MLAELVCPVCRTPVAVDPAGGRRCSDCARVFPLIAGILDMRIAGDRYLTLDEDREKALALAAIDGGFEDVLRAYWARTPEVPADLAARYVRAALDGPRRGDAHLRRIGATSGTLLDVGCGTGGLVAAASHTGLRAVGTDIALRWLVVAQRLLSEQGLDADLVAADGALLPFKAGSFDIVTCIETLEHATDRRGLLHACLAATRTDGVAYVVTANRFTLAPEPTVGLWGIGWLPRRVAVRYAERRRHTRYAAFTATSVSELGAFLGPGSHARVGPAVLPPPPSDASRARRVADRAYDALRRHGPARVVRHGSPYLEVIVDGRSSAAVGDDRKLDAS